MKIYGGKMNRKRTNVTDKITGSILSVVLHLVALSLLIQIPLFPDISNSPNEKKALRPHPSGGTVSSSKTRLSSPSVSVPFFSELPLSWGSPVFAREKLGPEIVTLRGKMLNVHADHSSFSLHPPEFVPYIPPAVNELAIDFDQDVLNRSKPADYTREELDLRKRLFYRSLVEDLRDCRMDQIPLEEALLRLSYLRLQDQLLNQKQKPDFSYDEVRDLLRRKLAAVRREVNAAGPDAWPVSLLLSYRKDKIYEEKRGHSLYNSIWYDIYNCRTGTEELLIYFSRYHPELELATVRGSVLKYDGTILGHMDPAVKIDGRWMVFKTVSMDTALVEEYKTGELYRLEKIVLDYLPELDNDFCRIAMPLARNGETLDGDHDLYTKSDHQLAVKDKVSPILLWRENTPYTGPFRVMGREDRILHDMIVRYHPLSDERRLLNEDDPFADLLFHLLMTPPGERQSLLDLYLRKRVTIYPVKFKRPLRLAAYLPGYGDLLTTLEQRSMGTVEISPGNLMPLSYFVGHDEYLRLNRKRMAELTHKPLIPAKQLLPDKVKAILFWAPPKGISAIFPPPLKYSDIIAGLLEDQYDLAVPLEMERASRINNTSARKISIQMAKVIDAHSGGPDALEKRITLLRTVLAHKSVDFTEGKVRARHEIPSGLSFENTVTQGGRNGLSPGFIKDMIDLLGETEAVQLFDRYLQPVFTAQSGTDKMIVLSRQRTAEMLGYFDRYLLGQKSREKLVQTAWYLYKDQPDLAIRTGAAQFLVSQRKLEPAQATEVYGAYLEQAPFDVQELSSLLATGLDKKLAAIHLQKTITNVSLSGLNRWDQRRLGNDKTPPELLALDELMRAGRMLHDDQALRNIAKKHNDLLEDVFKAGILDGKQDIPHYANGLNTLSALARSGIFPDKTVFSHFVAFGANDPAAFLFAKLMSDWLGQDHYRGLLAAKVASEKNVFNIALKSLAIARARLEPTQMALNTLPRYDLMAEYKTSLNTLSAKAAAITFLNGLQLLEGQTGTAHRLQSDLLRELFDQIEFQEIFSKTYGAEIAAVRDECLLDEHLFRAVEFAGLFTQKNGKKGDQEINHAPTIRTEGSFHAPCGPMARIIDLRNKPNNVLFTKADIYFNSLMDSGNRPKDVAKALSRERELRKILSKQSLTPEIDRELEDTEAFFQDLVTSSFCDIKRIYLLEKLLRRAVLPEKLPDWMLTLVRDSYIHEKKYLTRINEAGGVSAIFRDYRTLSQTSFRQKWGEHPFSIRNLYGTLVLVKMGLLKMNEQGELE
ncbi:MAG: hypothetical protein ACOZF0_20015 [Thermodesulfobacteriota bacterium]